jgi:hypothetical protein
MAHHCDKTEWQEAAYAQVRSGTAWAPMEDFVAFAVTEFLGQSPECAAHADEWTAAWMEMHDVEVEPLIHMKATAGGGAHDRNGKNVPPFSYLSDADFGELVGMIMSEADCADLEPPAGP